MDHSDSRRNRVEELLKIYLEGSSSLEEERELFDLIDINVDEEIIKKFIDSIILEHDIEDDSFNVNWDKLYGEIIQRKNGASADSKVRRIFLVRWVAAAVVTLLLGTGYYFLILQKSNGQNEIVKMEQIRTVDVAPPTSADAVLTLANGQKIILDSAGNGTIVRQGMVEIEKMADGQIAYRGEGSDAGYNTLSNPRGSKAINIRFSDGSRVWLNVASTIRYPVAFNGKERKVEISGEAYFEVAHNPAKPFIVSKGDAQIKVLGTHFNVKAYDDESTLDVTLLEGSVSVETTENIARPKIIRPGEQARIAQNGAISLKETVNLNEVMAWRSDMFSFNGANIESIMRQLSRWYNVEVIIKKPVKEKFYAEVSRNTNISTLLEMLEATKAVHFEMEEERIVVTP